MDASTTQLLIDSAFAGGIGLVIGLEREHHDVSDGTLESSLGVRTFTLLALFGWISAYLGERTSPWVPGAALAVVGAVLAIQYGRVTHTTGHGLTTEVAALCTLVLGMLVHIQRPLAVALALLTTLLLISKPWFREVVPKLRRVELTATLQLLIVLAVVLPLLPTEARDPWHVLSPRKIGLFVTLIAGISYVGYILSRLLGQTRGSGVAGVVGGLASSTAVTAAMAQEAKRSKAMIVPGQLATFLANTVMFVRVLVVTALLSREVARRLLVPLGAMGAFMLAGAAWKWRAMKKTPKQSADAGALELRNPFALVPALKWGLILCAVLVLSSVAQQHLGDRGLLVMAGVSGVADVDAITLAVSRQVSDGALSARVASLAVVLAVLANTTFKGGLAWITGGRAYGADIVKVFAAVLAVGIALVWLV